MHPWFIGEQLTAAEQNPFGPQSELQQSEALRHAFSSAIHEKQAETAVLQVPASGPAGVLEHPASGAPTKTKTIRTLARVAISMVRSLAEGAVAGEDFGMIGVFMASKARERWAVVSPPKIDGILPEGLAPEALRLHLEVVDRDGRIRLLPASFWKSLDPQLVTLWGILATRWGIVTVELVEWLREKIHGRKAIEIGAGAGDLGYHLGIPQTDSYAHAEHPAALARARYIGHPVPRPPFDVRKIDALKAVQALRPEVVIASWVTEFGTIPRAGVEDHSCDFGVRETAIVKLADYILVGNINSHGAKRILELPHEEHKMEWLVSRAFAPEQDRIWCWRRRRKKA